MLTKLRCLNSFLILVFLALCVKPAVGQDWFRTAIGMDANKPRLAIADFVPRPDTAKAHSFRCSSLSLTCGAGAKRTTLRIGPQMKTDGHR